MDSSNFTINNSNEYTFRNLEGYLQFIDTEGKVATLCYVFESVPQNWSLGFS